MRTSARSMAMIEAEAAAWLVRRSEPEHSSHEDDEFFAWLEVDPRHGEVYDELARALEDVGNLTHLHVRARSLRGGFWRIGAPTFAGLAALVIGAVFLLLRVGPGSGTTFVTAIGETRTVTLADGSLITLGGSTRVIATLEKSGRRVSLEQGEAFFEVARDVSRPFVVEAGGTRVRALGTKFDVHRGVSGVRVTVQEGRVEVRDSRAVTVLSSATRVLTGGQQTEVPERPLYVSLGAVPPEVQTVSVDQPGAWRSGRFGYDDVRLGEVIADINRYYAPAVRLANEAAAEIRVTAAFRGDQIPEFLEALPDTLPVRVERNDSGTYILSSAWISE